MGGEGCSHNVHGRGKKDGAGVGQGEAATPESTAKGLG